MPVGEVPVQVQSAQEPLAEGGVRPGAAAVEHAEEPRPAQDPERRLHRGGPVHGLRVRIGIDPALEHRAHGFGVALVAREQVRLARWHQPLEPREIPGHLDVARVVRVHVDDVAHVAAWPGDARLVVPQPVDVRPEIHRLGPEQPHAVGEGVLRGRQDPLFVARAQAPVLGRVDPGGVRRVGSRGEAGPERVEVGRFARPQQATSVEAARAPGGDVALGLDLRLVDQRGARSRVAACAGHGGGAG